ncbi:signal recognition particle-docking protein FtsY [Pusillimonas sp. CC-YST705]|uniref:Signal recognition particle receptor FtsY n=1 Tax=Mesopusillimonas faecipullorum TaxID=2755040 RepID=A0ABS8CC62_9BURK|nr:signal recognition particle-docking protein FtsY [Mesopusillimonas faecipullorum]MCB5363437.1 signal recognition particle-docking protein FtsY [Mesopusillimonas faecipullorum]
MFSFFKRKKAPEPNKQTPEEVAEVAPAQVEEALAEVPPVEAALAPPSVTPIVESEPKAPVLPEVEPEPVSYEPQQEAAPDLGVQASAEPTPEVQPPAKKASWLSRLTRGLSRTGQSIGGLFVGAKVDDALYEELETALIMADAGMEATEKLLGALRVKVRKEKITDAAQVKTALRDLIAEHLAPLERAFPLDRPAPQVVMIAGVNGAGKTTSIGKLAHAFQANNKKVLLAAGDTFRAAAREQLVIWGERNNVAVIAQDGGDPAAVAFDAVNAGRARGMDIVMVDTAGRLPTQLHLMEELKKIRRVVGKADAQAPHEVLLVVDGNTGQNALAQIRAFDAAINLTGLVVTKLDGTAKGGVLAAVAAGSQGVRPVPVYWIGVGEGMDDLQPFVAKEFAAALVGD